MKKQTRISGLHITRAELRADRVNSIIGRRDNLTAEEKMFVGSRHGYLARAQTASEILIEKFRRAGRRVREDGTIFGTTGRYHYSRNCLYFSRLREGVVAEAAYYMHLDGIKIGNFDREYRILSVKFTDLPVSIVRRHSRNDLVCDGHPLRQHVEDEAIRRGELLLTVPSARRDGHTTVVAYDSGKFFNITETERLKLAYQMGNPAIILEQDGQKAKTYVIRTMIYS
jgi:hypothetical protein